MCATFFCTCCSQVQEGKWFWNIISFIYKSSCLLFAKKKSEGNDTPWKTCKTLYEIIFLWWRLTGKWSRGGQKWETKSPQFALLAWKTKYWAATRVAFLATITQTCFPLFILNFSSFHQFFFNWWSFNVRKEKKLECIKWRRKWREEPKNSNGAILIPVFSWEGNIQRGGLDTLMLLTFGKQVKKSLKRGRFVGRKEDSILFSLKVQQDLGSKRCSGDSLAQWYLVVWAAPSCTAQHWKV